MILALVPAGKLRMTVLTIVLRTAKEDPRRIERKHPMLFNSPQEGCYVLHGYSRVQILEPMAQSEFVFHGDWAGLRFLLGVKYTICVGTSSTETQVQVFSVSFLIFFFYEMFMSQACCYNLQICRVWSTMAWSPLNQSYYLHIRPTLWVKRGQKRTQVSAVIYNTKQLKIFSYTIKLQYNHDFSNPRFFDRNSQ